MLYIDVNNYFKTTESSEYFKDTTNVFIEAESRLLDHEIPTTFLTKDATISGTGDTVTSFITENCAELGDSDVAVETFSFDTLPEAIHTIIDNVLGNRLLANYNTECDADVSSLITLLDNTPAYVWYSFDNSGESFIPVDSFFYTTLANKLVDMTVYFRINIGTIPFPYDFYVDVNLCNVKYYKLDSDVYCTDGPGLKNINTVVDLDVGSMSYLVSDVYVTEETTTCFDACLYNSNISCESIMSHITTISGRVQGVGTELCCSMCDNVGLSTDVKHRSIFVKDFFLNQHEFATASSIAWVDIVDYVYPIIEDSINITVDGATASGLFITDIDNGKRVSYNPIYNFYSFGQIDYRVYAESSIGEVVDESFYLLHGYDLSLDEPIIFEREDNVFVRSVATNLVNCPHTSSCTYSFKTVRYNSLDINMSIKPIAINYKNIGVSIYPQSKTLFYGSTYTVTLSGVKDFNGNVMEPFEYIFTVNTPDVV